MTDGAADNINRRAERYRSDKQQAISVTCFTFLLLSFCIPTSSACMYHHLVCRQRDLISLLVQLLRENNNREMALDSRFFSRSSHGIEPGLGSKCSTSSISGASAVSGNTVPTTFSMASSAALSSSASSPSLRARGSVVVPVGRQDGVGSPTPGGNVKVVVRVRKFLARGMSSRFIMRVLEQFYKTRRLFFTSADLKV